MRNNNQTNAYLAYSNSENVLVNSSSGGVFFHIANDFIKNGGIVYGATIDNQGNVYHIGIDNVNNLSQIMKSKYVESDLRNAYKEIKELLLNDKKILFSGTPCQVALLDIYLKNINKNNLLLLDIICHGTPKKEYWHMYLNKVRKTQVLDINFRDKSKGWEDFSLKINDTIEKHQNNIYMEYFLKNYILLEKCYFCAFKGENRRSDITLGDAWGMEEFAPNFYNKNGTSLVILRNNKLNVFNSIERIPHTDVDYSIATYYANIPYYLSPKKPDDLKEKLKLFTDIKPLKIEAFQETKSHRFHKIRHLLYERMYKKYGIKLNKKKKYDVGILTNDGYFNYGNRLQNFALHIILRNNGYKTININQHKYDWAPFILTYNRITQGKNRYYAIYKASRKYEGKYYILEKTNNDFSNIGTLLFGSDQIWNPYFTDSTPYTLGLFIKHPKMISYAASFGVKTIDKCMDELYKRQLAKFSHISVREHDALDIVNNLGYKAVVDLDPTLLLTKEEWDRAILKYSSLKVKKGYVVKFFLSNENTYTYDCGNAVVYNPLDGINGKVDINQFDFIKLIKDCDFIITDSFHATVFGLLYSKKIILFNRRIDEGDMSTRFNSLFSILSGEVEKKNGYIEIQNTFDNQKLRMLRERSLTNLLISVKK